MLFIIFNIQSLTANLSKHSFPNLQNLYHTNCPKLSIFLHEIIKKVVISHQRSFQKSKQQFSPKFTSIPKTITIPIKNIPKYKLPIQTFPI